MVNVAFYGLDALTKFVLLSRMGQCEAFQTFKHIRNDTQCVLILKIPHTVLQIPLIIKHLILLTNHLKRKIPLQQDNPCRPSPTDPLSSPAQPLKDPRIKRSEAIINDNLAHTASKEKQIEVEVFVGVVEGIVEALDV